MFGTFSKGMEFSQVLRGFSTLLRLRHQPVPQKARWRGVFSLALPGGQIRLHPLRSQEARDVDLKKPSV